MANIFDYINWRGDLSVKAAPLNEVDFAIFAWLSYAPLEGYIPEDCTETAPAICDISKEFFVTHNLEAILKKSVSFTKTSMLALKTMAETERFRNIRVCCFESNTNVDKQVQFAALTFLTDDNTAVVTFRGTDDTLVGWREDFNMAFTDEVPGQKMAAEYLEKVAKSIKGDIYVCGHSKGGNLAVYSVMKASKRLRNRIKKVYSFDGPGFGENTDLGDAVDEVYAKTVSIVPEESLVGMLLNHDKDYTVVPSDAKLIMQHDITTWHVMGPRFQVLPGLKPSSIALSETIHKWLANIDDVEREVFVNALFDVLMSTDSTTINEINEDAFGYAMNMIKTMSGLPKETKKFLKSIVQEFIKQGSSIIIREAEKKTENLKPKPKKVSKVLIDTPK